MILSLLPVTASAEPEETQAVETAAPMIGSDDAIALLKLEEGFSKKPYWDYAQWTVGYGTACPEDKREYYTQNGISEEEAEALLRQHVSKFEGELHKFMDKTGVALTQNQFDALLLFSYNCGSGWSYDTKGGLYNAVASGATGSALVDAFSRWCNAGGQIQTFLLRRRLCEANIYLNGVYSQKAPESLGYVLYDACGGVSRPNVQGYDVNQTAKVIPVPTYEGYQFAGWYTARIGGKQVNVLDSGVRNGRLYAHWIDKDGNDSSEAPADGVTVTVTTDGVNLRKGPGTSYSVIGTANKGDQFTIVETADGSGYTWGKYDSGWICLQYTDFETASKPGAKPEEPTEPAPTEPEPTEPPATEPEVPKIRMGTVKVSDTLRVRSGPSTGHEVVDYLKNGTRVEILEEKIVGAMVWGKIKSGWISMSYVELDKQEETTPPPTEPAPTEPKPTEPIPSEPANPQQTWTGTVNVKDFLRVRSGPSTSTEVVGYLYPNEKVTITEKKTTDTMTWGKISKGWISLDYITLDKTEVAPEKVSGTVKVDDFLRVRSGPGTSYAIAGYLSPNAKVEILEQKTVGSILWGRVEKGWISMDYVVLDKPAPEEPEKIIKTVTADCLRIRSEASTSATIVGYLYDGTKVEILETKTVGGTVWGRVAKGWISMDYVK